jgi:hypothetical protein
MLFLVETMRGNPLDLAIPQRLVYTGQHTSFYLAGKITYDNEVLFGLHEKVTLMIAVSKSRQYP